MAVNSVLLSLVQKASDRCIPESGLKDEVKFHVEERAIRIAVERLNLFERSCLPRTSVLARLTQPDREAIFAHYRAKELRNVADAIRIGDDSAKRRARKRVSRMDKLEAAFKEVDCEGFIVA